jgi:hypothetical protein
MSQLYVDNIKGRTGGAIGAPAGAVVTGVATATQFSGNIVGVAATFSGNVSIAGSLTYEDVTNVDSVGVITARSGIEFGESGVGGTITATGQAEFAGVCTASSFSGSFDGSTASFSGNVSIADSIIHTGDTDTSVRFPAANTFTVETGGSERLRISPTAGLLLNNGELVERVNITAGKLSDNVNINLDNGMVHYFTTTETTTSTPNIMSSVGIDTTMATGDTMAVTVITTADAAGYSARVKIDGSLTGITTSWVGGSEPSAGGSSGVENRFNRFLIYSNDYIHSCQGSFDNRLVLTHATKLIKK